MSAQIASMIERLDDLMLQALYEASSRGDAERPEIDRQLVRVRRSLERAIALIGQD